MKSAWALCLALCLCLIVSGIRGESTNALNRLNGIHRIVFLGDSITYSGQYIEFVEAYYATRFPTQHIEFLNLGLPSETVSGLSEDGHAGGKFPRPELRERIDRVLEKTKPDLVIACYGMNDGIYVGSSRVDLQACKLEYSIVSPK